MSHMNQHSCLPYPFLSVDEFLAIPSSDWLVKDIFPRTGLGAIFGQSGSGKSFLTLHFLAALSQGSTWFGFDVEACRAMYFSLEGVTPIQKRVRAYKRKGISDFDNTYFGTQSLSLLSTADVDRLIQGFKECMPDGGVVVFDTLNRASPGADENQSTDMGNIIHAMCRIRDEANCLVLLVHHCGKSASAGMRGHSSLMGAVDVIIEVERPKNGDRSWKVTKQKDGEELGPYRFSLESVVIGKDKHGTDITSCVVSDEQANDFSLARSPVQKKLSKNQAAALSAIKNRIAIEGSGEVASLSFDDAISCVMDAIIADVRHHKQRAKEAIESLIKLEYVELIDSRIYLP